MKKITLSTMLILTSIFANAANNIELNTKQSIKLTKLMESSGAQEELDGRTSTFVAESVSCTLERTVGYSCIWKITKEDSEKTIEQELNEKQSKFLYNLLSKAGVEEELDGPTSTYNVSKIECSQERFVEQSCILIK